MQGEELRALRRRLGLSQVELSDMLGVDQGSVSRWETGRGSPRPRTVRRMRDLLLSDDHRRANARQMGLVVGNIFSAALVDGNGQLARFSAKGLEHYERTRGLDARTHLGLAFPDHRERIGNGETGAFLDTHADLLADCVMMRLALNIRGAGSVVLAEPLRDKDAPAGFVVYTADTYDAEPTEDIRLEAVDVQLLDDPTRFQAVWRREVERQHAPPGADGETPANCIFPPFRGVTRMR